MKDGGLEFLIVPVAVYSLEAGVTVEIVLRMCERKKWGRLRRLKRDGRIGGLKGLNEFLSVGKLARRKNGENRIGGRVRFVDPLWNRRKRGFIIRKQLQIIFPRVHLHPG